MMSLQEAIEEMKRETPEDQGVVFERVGEVSKWAEAIATILNAVVKGELKHA